jgi:cysteine synthase
LRCNNILESVGHTPLVRLNRLTAGLDAEVYVKADYMNPGGERPHRHLDD